MVLLGESKYISRVVWSDEFENHENALGESDRQIAAMKLSSFRRGK